MSITHRLPFDASALSPEAQFVLAYDRINFAIGRTLNQRDGIGALLPEARAEVQRLERLRVTLAHDRDAGLVACIIDNEDPGDWVAVE